MQFWYSACSGGCVYHCVGEKLGYNGFFELLLVYCCILDVFFSFWNVVRIFSAKVEEKKRNRMGSVVLKLQAFNDSRPITIAHAANTGHCGSTEHLALKGFIPFFVFFKEWKQNASYLSQKQLLHGKDFLGVVFLFESGQCQFIRLTTVAATCRFSRSIHWCMLTKKSGSYHNYMNMDVQSANMRMKSIKSCKNKYAL